MSGEVKQFTFRPVWEVLLEWEMGDSVVLATVIAGAEAPMMAEIEAQARVAAVMGLKPTDAIRTHRLRRVSLLDAMKTQSGAVLVRHAKNEPRTPNGETSMSQGDETKTTKEKVQVEEWEWRTKARLDWPQSAAMGLLLGVLVVVAVFLVVAVLRALDMAAQSF